MLRNEGHRLLLIVAHPHLQRSRANRAVVEAAGALSGVTLHNLYDLYPYFHIDVAQEKQTLMSHDAILIQHPLHWYNMPALMKLWLDEVFELGWAYGSGGDKLRGKHVQLSLTVGGAEESFSEKGENRYPLETLLTPWRQTVQLCQMIWHPPIVLHNSNKTTDANIEEYARRVCERIEKFLRPGGWN